MKKIYFSLILISALATPVFCQIAATFEAAASPEMVSTLETAVSAEASQNQPGQITGLIIDTRGRDFQPSINPVISIAGGLIFYDVNKVEANSAAHGIVTYCESSREAAAFTDKVGKNPLYLKAVSISGENKTDIIINPVDNQTLSPDFFEKCRVSVIINLPEAALSAEAKRVRE